MTGQAKGPGVISPDPSTLSGGTPGGALGEKLAELVKPRGLFMTEDHRYYWNGEGPLPSVTTVLKVLDKPAVVRWYGQQIAKAAFRNPAGDEWENLEDEYVRFLEAQPKEITDVAAKLGTSVHVLADQEARADGKAATVHLVPDEALPYLEAFRGFLAFLGAQGGIIVSSEKAVVNLSEGYAGTYDLLVSLPRFKGTEPDAFDLWLIDVKTSRGYYPEFALQLAGYGMAEFIGLEGDPTPYPMPTVDRYGILHLRPDAYEGEAAQGWRLVEYPITDEDRLAFLATLSIYIWKGKGRFTKSILKKAMYQGQLEGIGTDPLTRE